MRSRASQSVVVSVLVVLASWSLSAATFDTYRDFTLRDSTASVLARTHAPDRDLKTLHDRPNVVQELTWRPPSLIGRPVAEREAVAAIVFSFLDDQLFRISVTYEPSRTEGLTKQDLIDSLSATYGTPSSYAAPPPRRPAYDSLSTPTLLATWRSADTTVALNQVAYSRGVGLVITSNALEAAARKAQAAAVAMDAREAPAREAARVKADADAARAAAEKTRSTNKGAFKP